MQPGTQAVNAIAQKAEICGGSQNSNIVLINNANIVGEVIKR